MTAHESTGLGAYERLAQVGAGADGVSYRARDDQGRIVLLHDLSRARTDAARWPGLLKRIRTVALLSHPATVRILGHDLGHDLPAVVQEWVNGGGFADWEPRRPVSLPEALPLALALAGALAEGHRLGVSHGSVDPHHVRRAPDGTPRLDFAALATSEDPPPRTSDPRDDVRGLGEILRWLCFESTSFAGPTPLRDLLDAMRAEDPEERPTAHSILAQLQALEDRTSLHARTVEVPWIAPDTTMAVGEAPDENVVDPLRRGRLGRYRLLERLGQGGMGAVYRGEDLSDGAIVAIKVLRPEWAGREDLLRRFRKEARLLAEVNNPFVTNLLEVNEDDGIHFLVLEFVAGQNLGALLTERGRLDEATALGIAADVARALGEAHRRGIVHRDVKPENVLLAQVPGEPSADAGSAVTDPRPAPAKTEVIDPGPPPAETEVIDPASAAQRPALEGTEVMDPGPAPKATEVMDLGPASGMPAPAPDSGLPFQVKLSDFGLARHVVETESLQLTQATIVGTPQYMAPEQCVGDPIDPRADVYALGATLFHLLAGRPPFLAKSIPELFRMHREEPAPPLGKFNSEASEGACQIVAKALAKAPEERYADADAMLRDLERLLRGEPSHVEVHPRLPAHDPETMLDFDFRWELESPPRLLWPHVANTERLNRAIGLPAVDFSTEVGDDGRVRRFARAKLGGLPAVWEEHPFEWVEPRRFGVLREYSRGPFHWVVSLVELIPAPGGGTTLSHRVRFEPSHPLLRPILAMKIGRESRAALERVYRRIDAAVAGKLGRGGVGDPFEPPIELPRARRKTLDERLDRLIAHGVAPAVVEDLGEFLARAPVQDVSRIRPLALARRLGLDPSEFVDACLIGAHEGLLVLLWDLLCPVCRIPSEAAATLRELREHAHCAACNLDYELDFANSIEMVFRVHPDIRDTELGIFCIGGPAHSPHVVAQVRVAGGERLELNLALPEGTYRLRGPQLPNTLDLRIEPGVTSNRLELSLGHIVPSARPASLRAGGQTLDLLNETDRELIVRVERIAPRDDAVTAARASALALFRDLFPGELLAAGHQVRVATITLLLTQLENSDNLYRHLGDAQAFEVLRDHFHRLDSVVRREGGALVKTVGEGIVAAFSDPVGAIRAGLELPRALQEGETTRNLRVRAAIHRGPTMAATINDHLDYFGATVHRAARMLAEARGQELLLSGAVAGEPAVAALFREQGLEAERAGGRDSLLLRVPFA